MKNRIVLMSLRSLGKISLAIAPLWVILPDANAVAQPKPVPQRSPRHTKTPVFSGQKVRDEAIVPEGNQETITEIIVRFVDQQGNLIAGQTKPQIITQEFTLQPGERYRPELAKKGLQAVLDLAIVERASLRLEPVGINQGIMAIAIQESSNLTIGFDLTLPPPTALQGSVRPTTVKALSDSSDGFSTGVQVGLLNLGGNNQGVSLGVEGGADSFGFNLGYRKFLRHNRGFGLNLFNRRGIESEFTGGNPELNLDNGNKPVVHRLGGGIEYFYPLAKDWQSAIGISYQRVSIRDGVFSGQIAAQDALGNTLTVSESGQDDLLTLNFTTVLNRENNSRNPTRGYQLQLGSDQYLPVGEAAILANRLAVNYTHYLPLALFTRKGAETLIFNFQGGTILGDALPYEAFILGGSSSVRGYGGSKISTARSFVQGSIEYRYPILKFKAFNNQIDLGGTLFFDYANDLGSADAVIGQPSVVRNRPGDGFGYGLGLRALTPIGAIRTEFAFNDEGNTKFIWAIGDRF